MNANGERLSSTAIIHAGIMFNNNLNIGCATLHAEHRTVVLLYLGRDGFGASAHVKMIINVCICATFDVHLIQCPRIHRYSHTHTQTDTDTRSHMVFIKLQSVCAQPLRSHKMIECCVMR